MGTSTDAIFGFGWVGDEEFSIDPPENEEEGAEVWEDGAAQRACEKLGVELGSHCRRLQDGLPRVRRHEGHERHFDMLHKEYPSVAEGIKLPSAAEIEFTWFLCSNWN